MDSKRFKHLEAETGQDLIKAIEALKVSKDEMLILRSSRPLSRRDTDIMQGHLKTLGESGVYGILISSEFEVVDKASFEKFVIQQFVNLAAASLDPEQFDRLKGIVLDLCKNRSCLDEEFHTEVFEVKG